VLDFDQINEVASYTGFPNRYPHWRFGMEFEQMQKGYRYGLQKIYEMVINNDPCYAYLLESNSLVDQKLVMAHVYAHCDFFKNNYTFARTNRKMIDQMANHGARVARHMARHGIEKVEDFIDSCLSLESLIDVHAPFVRRRAKPPPSPASGEPQDGAPAVRRLRSREYKDYMDEFMNPPEFLEAMERRQKEEREKERSFPAEPERDVLLFLIENAPLEDWQRDILAIIRSESYYFAPQAQTKIMNEGWATYWHSTIMTQRVLTDSELIDYADHHAGTVATRPGVLNPYKIGVELFRDIEDRWNRGCFGTEWDECADVEARIRWDRKAGLGRKKIFEVRRHYNDITFIDTFLTKEFCEQHKLFAYRWNERTNRAEIDSRDFKLIKEKILFQLTNLGNPIITVEDANYRNRSELLMRHESHGMELDIAQARDTLTHVQKLWARPVSLFTQLGGKGRLVRFDGAEHSETETQSP